MPCVICARINSLFNIILQAPAQLSFTTSPVVNAVNSTSVKVAEIATFGSTNQLFSDTKVCAISPMLGGNNSLNPLMLRVRYIEHLRTEEPVREQRTKGKKNSDVKGLKDKKNVSFSSSGSFIPTVLTNNFSYT